MAEERRLKKVHKTTALALYQRGQELEREIQEINAAIQSNAKDWAKAYGLPKDMNFNIEGKEDGELYLVATPKPESPENGREVHTTEPIEVELVEAAEAEA